jgi:hypothetical protein
VQRILAATMVMAKKILWQQKTQTPLPRCPDGEAWKMRTS